MKRTGLFFLILFICSVVLSFEGVFAQQYNGSCTLNNTNFTLPVNRQSYTFISFDTDLVDKNLTFDENITCHWKITAPPGYFVKIKFVKFKSCCELVGNCSYHYFEAREGRNESGPLLSKLCNEEEYHMPSSQIYSVGTDLFAKFYFKKNRQDVNFTLAFTANISAVRHVSSCSQDNDNSANNNIILKGSQGMFKTPYSSIYQGYPPNTECKWKIMAPPGYIIKVEFSSFVLTSFEDCDTDRVIFYDGVFLIDSNTFLSAYKISLGKYCGTSARTVYSFTSGITVYFFAGSYDDVNVPRDGIAARYQILKQESSGPCTDKRPSNQMSGQGGTLVTPNYPFNYPNNESCTWVLTPLKGQHLQFSTYFNSNLKPSDYYLEVRRGTTVNGTLVGSYSSGNLPVVIYASDSLWVQFVNKDNKSLLAGFIGSYESIMKIPPVCSPLNNATVNDNLQLSDHRGSLRSPYYPGNYPNKGQCTWKIKGLPGKRIKLTLKDIDLGAPSNGCQSDYLQIRNGLSESSLLLENYCKANKNQDIYSDSNSMWIRFHSDSNKTFRGFDASYVINELCDKFNSYEANNNIRFKGSSGNFSSPNYPGNYPVIICTWKITVPEGKRVKLTFSHFSVDKTASDCGNPGAFITVYNGIGIEYDDKIGDYCGTDIPGPIYSKDNTMTVYFQSLTGKASSGFKAQFDAAAPKLNLAAIIGGTVGGVILLIIIGVLVYYFVARKRRRQGHERMY